MVLVGGAREEGEEEWRWWDLRLVGRGSKLVGCGSAVPTTVISNDDLSKFVDTSDDWIAVRTGIRT
ncbi:unnamed protein product, partial [Sphagnum compactum]